MGLNLTLQLFAATTIKSLRASGMVAWSKLSLRLPLKIPFYGRQAHSESFAYGCLTLSCAYSRDNPRS